MLINSQNFAARETFFTATSRRESWDYSAQVPRALCAAREAALLELAAGIRKGTDHLETMLLIDVSDPMTWNPHQGIEGPDYVLTRDET